MISIVFPSLPDIDPKHGSSQIESLNWPHARDFLALRRREIDPQQGFIGAGACPGPFRIRHHTPDARGEVDGKDYHFIDQEKFDQMVAQDELLEYATVFQNSYGTPRAYVESELAAGRDVMFDIDWQGAQQLRQRMGQDVVSVFILPPRRA